ncbi:6-phospho-3-hexuloisomerase [Priestia endophytica]|uniref:6-phospho-3-hexuloisomerase n=1 Tax=Priestia endophytica TaxID=135735 RepID=UPI003D2A80F2
MDTIHYFNKIVKELEHSAPLISSDEAETLFRHIVGAKKVFVAGAGRSGFIAKSFAMRMMHMGIDAYVVGETVTATFKKDDLLLLCTGSGETKTLTAIGEKAKTVGGTIAVVTLSPLSTIGKMANTTVTLPGAPKDQDGSHHETIQPMGSLFEQIMLLFFDALILRFMHHKELDTNKMYGKHANLE